MPRDIGDSTLKVRLRRGLWRLFGFERGLLAPKMGELKTANHLVGDRAWLDEAWDRYGYWFFKSVIPVDVIRELRSRWLAALRAAGVADAGDEHGVYNGASLELLAEQMGAVKEAKTDQVLATHAVVSALMKEILGDDPVWLPLACYRAVPPVDSPDTDRLVTPHQDGFYSPGIPMRSVWVPLDRMDDAIGGVAVLEGLHKGPFLHDLSKPPYFPIPRKAVPRSGWKRSVYEPGDLLIFHRNLPHAGLSNLSDRYFRLSMDTRVVGASEKVPIVGPIISLSSAAVSVRNDLNGEDRTYLIDDDTVCRAVGARKEPRENIPIAFSIGETVILTSEDGEVATLLRSLRQ